MLRALRCACWESGPKSTCSDTDLAGQLANSGQRMMIDDEPRPRGRASARPRSARGGIARSPRGAWLNQSRNSFSAMLFTRRVIGEDTLSRTRVLSLYQSAGCVAKTKSFILTPFVAEQRSDSAVWFVSDHLENSVAAATCGHKRVSVPRTAACDKLNRLRATRPCSVVSTSARSDGSLFR
jgi:hypothetical protein